MDDKIKELAKNGELATTLLDDENFITEAKEIFKTANIEINDQELEKILNETQEILKNGSLTDSELEEIAGAGKISHALSIAGFFSGIYGGERIGREIGKFIEKKFNL